MNGFLGVRVKPVPVEATPETAQAGLDLCVLRVKGHFMGSITSQKCFSNFKSVISFFWQVCQVRSGEKVFVFHLWKIHVQQVFPTGMSSSGLTGT